MRKVSAVHTLHPPRSPGQVSRLLGPALGSWTSVVIMKLLTLLEQGVPHFQFALGTACDVLFMPTLYTHKHTHACTHTTISQVTLDVQKFYEAIQRLKKDPFSFPGFLEGGVCMRACACRCVYVSACGELSGGTMCPGREPGQWAAEEVVRMALIFTQSERGTPVLVINSPGSKPMSLKTCHLGDRTRSPCPSWWPQ